MNIMTKRGNLDNVVTYEHFCDTFADLNNIPASEIFLGSTAVVIQGESGFTEFYIANSNKEWVPIVTSEGGGGLGVHICAEGEYDSSGVPTIEFPDENTFYFVPGGTSPNLYTEWIYANSAWEQVGSSTIDLSAYATKADTVLETTLSRGRKDGTTVGEGSFAFGSSVEASGNSAHAEGGNTVSSGLYSHAEGSATTASIHSSHAEGNATTASGTASHAEGYHTTTSGQYSHAEGAYTTAQGIASHAEGLYTIGAGRASHVAGKYNIIDSYDSWPEWTANTSYSIGDKVKVTTTSNNTTIVTGYVCKTANSDASFTSSNWQKHTYMNYATIVGNGDDENSRSNAYALDWDGNEHLMGDVYVGCNADSSGGIKLARLGDVQINGTSIVSNGVANIQPIIFDNGASDSNYGVVKIKYLANGLTLTSQGHLAISPAPIDNIKNPVSGNYSTYRPIVPLTEHYATFYGLAKAAGDSTQSASSNAVGTYTDSAKQAIQEMIGVENRTVTVTGTDPVIVGQADTSYLCGEVSTLSITPPAQGVIDVIFSSGSSATILTLPNTVRMPEWFEVEANHTYEINIANGVYGVVTSWAD